MSLLHPRTRRSSKLATDASFKRPLLEPLEHRQLFAFGTADIAVLEVRNPALPAALKVEARPKGSAAVVLQNQGAEKYRGRVTIELQLSPDGQWDDSNPALKTVTKNIQGLRANAKRVFQIKLPKISAGVAEGTYRIAARITVEGEDGATSNNTGAGWKTTHTGTPAASLPNPPVNPNPPANPNPPQNPKPEPEPQPTYVDLGIVPTISATRLEGSTETVLTFTITNHGTATVVDSISVDLWAGPNPDNTRGDVYLGSGGGAINLAPGESKTFSETIIAPIEHTGIVYFRAEMYDVPLIELGDVNGANDQTATGPVEIWHRNVNLSGTWAFDADPTQPALAARTGDVIKLRLQVTNAGTETFAGPVRATMLALPTGLSMASTYADITLAPGETKTAIVDLTVSPLLSLGDHPLRGRVDVTYNEGPNGKDNNKLPNELILRVE